MQIKFQADADFDGRVFRGLRRAAPEMDIRSAHQASLAGEPDSEVLRIAASTNRILLSRDVGTMPRHFRLFLTTSESPGVFVIRDGTSIGATIDEILLIWSASDPSEWANRLEWIPFQPKANVLR